MYKNKYVIIGIHYILQSFLEGAHKPILMKYIEFIVTYFTIYTWKKSSSFIVEELHRHSPGYDCWTSCWGWTCYPSVASPSRDKWPPCPPTTPFLFRHHHHFLLCVILPTFLRLDSNRFLACTHIPRVGLHREEGRRRCPAGDACSACTSTRRIAAAFPTRRLGACLADTGTCFSVHVKCTKSGRVARKGYLMGVTGRARRFSPWRPFLSSVDSRQRRGHRHSLKPPQPSTVLA